MHTPDQHHVAVLGASPKPERYANQTIKLLIEKGFRITPVHPKLEQIDDLPVAKGLHAIDDTVHTLTLYVGAARLEKMVDEVLALKPRRVVFNPGTESATLQNKLDEHGIPWLAGCTLVMLKTGTFLDWGLGEAAAA